MKLWREILETSNFLFILIRDIGSITKLGGTYIEGYFGRVSGSETEHFPGG